MDVEYLCISLLWSANLYQKLYFILVRNNDAQIVLLSTGLTLEAKAIIFLYSYRFQIETCFQKLKNGRLDPSAINYG